MPRFPNTAALIALEGEAIIDAILAHDIFTALMERKLEERYMASVQDLKDALNGATASFDNLVGKVGQSQGGIEPADLDPVLAEVNDLKSKIDAVISSLPTKTTASPDPTTGTSGTAPVGGV